MAEAFSFASFTENTPGPYNTRTTGLPSSIILSNNSCWTPGNPSLDLSLPSPPVTFTHPQLPPIAIMTTSEFLAIFIALSNPEQSSSVISHPFSYETSKRSLSVSTRLLVLYSLSTSVIFLSLSMSSELYNSKILSKGPLGLFSIGLSCISSDLFCSSTIPLKLTVLLPFLAASNISM